MKNEGERIAWASWQIFVMVSSLLGDTTILIASIKYNALHLHKIIVAFIQHIAVCDLLNVLGNLLPGFVSLMYNSGGSSKIFIYMRFFINYYVYIMSSCLIAAMTLSKLLLLRYPLKTGSWPKRRAHKLCAGIWVTEAMFPTICLLIDKDDAIFDFRLYVCNYMYSANVWKIIAPFSTLLLLFVPNITIIVSTILLLKEARKVVRGTREKLRRQGILTVVLTATIYTFSVLPATVYYVAEPFMEKDLLVPGPFFIEFYRVAGAFLDVNVLANFFVYSLTVTSFRIFLKTKFRQALSSCATMTHS